ncbi:MAG: DUF488 domain-containing protein [Thermodesulfobacteriota bacterium]|nr:DUF488 domain-containing protein [Thermodesulfobacteriota bacterium]
MNTIYTIGTSNRRIGEFIDVLIRYGIGRVVDVRSLPKSRFTHFNRENLERSLSEKGVKYRWMGDILGGFRAGGFKSYTKSDDFTGGISRLEKLARETPSAICCAERSPWECHRRFIARELERRKWSVLHILDKDRLWTHEQKELFEG